MRSKRAMIKDELRCGSNSFAYSGHVTWVNSGSNRTDIFFFFFFFFFFFKFSLETKVNKNLLIIAVMVLLLPD